MKALPGDVFVTGQVSAAQMQTLVEQGIRSFVNNRPDMEGPGQPTSAELAKKAEGLEAGYVHIPMAGGLTPELLVSSAAAYRDLPRPIVTFCASGMRSAALWGFAHVKDMGVDDVMTAIAEAGYNLEQIRGPLAQYAEQTDD